MAWKKIVTITGNSSCSWETSDEFLEDMRTHIPPESRVTGQLMEQGKILLFTTNFEPPNTATIEISFSSGDALTEYNESSNTNYSHIFTAMGWGWSVEDILES